MSELGAGAEPRASSASASPRLRAWSDDLIAVGDYRAEVWIGDEKANTQQFQIVDAPKAAS